MEAACLVTKRASRCRGLEFRRSVDTIDITSHVLCGDITFHVLCGDITFHVLCGDITSHVLCGLFPYLAWDICEISDRLSVSTPKGDRFLAYTYYSTTKARHCQDWNGFN